MTNFEALLQALTEARVKFIVVGAFAAVAQGSSQATRDLDICYERTTENLKSLAAALAPYHPNLRGAEKHLPFVLDAKTLSQGMNFTLETDLGDVDLMGSLSGVGGYAELVGDSIFMKLYGNEICIASLDAIIRSKRAAGRAKDLNAIPELEALKELRADPKKVN